MNSSAITLFPQLLQNAICQLHREGIAKEEILAVLPDILPPDICQALELQSALLSQCPSSINETFLFNLLFDCFTRGLEAPDILKVCSTFCTRSDYAFCLVALDYIEIHYQPTEYELKALKNQLYQEYLVGTPSIELAQRGEQSRNIYYKHLYFRTAELISQQEQLEQGDSAIAVADQDFQINSSLDDCQLDVADSLSSPPNVNQLGESLVELLKTFDINCSLTGVSSSPSFNRFKLRMGVGARVKKLTGIGEDLMASLGLNSAPIITAQSGYVAVDVPRTDRQIVAFTDYIKPALRSPTDPLLIAGGLDADGNFVEIELSDENVRHIIGGGITGSGKSQWEKAAVASLILRYPPSVVKLALSDVKRVTFKGFKKSPWLYAPVAYTAGDTLKMLCALTNEMDVRYDEFERVEADSIQVENIQEYNAALPHRSMTRIVCFIDEIFELLSDASYKEEIEKCLMRLLAKAGAAGIHMILFTQRPAANVINPLIRSNCPVKVALRVGRPEDSGIVLGDPSDRSAISLLGYGDLIIKGVEGNSRVQGLYISNEDLDAVLKQAESKLNDPYIPWNIKDYVDEKQPGYETLEKAEKVEVTQQSEPQRSFVNFLIADPMAEEVEEWVEEKIWALIDMNVPQNRIIMHVWGVAKGDTGYRPAREKFQLITGEAE